MNVADVGLSHTLHTRAKFGLEEDTGWLHRAEAGGREGSNRPAANWGPGMMIYRIEKTQNYYFGKS